jgi:hypothetical protein
VFSVCFTIGLTRYVLPIHNATIHYTVPQHIALHYTTLHYNTSHYTTLHYITSHYTTPTKTSQKHTTPHTYSKQSNNSSPMPSARGNPTSSSPTTQVGGSDMCSVV